ncbi:MAG: capsid protein [Clostridiales bacterium]|nr:capsid protein [Clostridiales bacterium]
MDKKNKDDKAYDLRLIFEQMELDLIKKLKQAFFFHKREEQKEGFQFEQWQLAKLRAMEKWRKLNKKLIGSRKKPVEDLVQKTLEESYSKGEERVIEAYENAKNKAELKGKAIIPEDTISEEAKKAKEIQETVTEQQGMKDIAPNKVVDKKVELPKTPRTNEELPKADPEESFFGVNEKKLNALIESVTNDLNKASTSIQRLLDDIYRQTIFKTHMYLQNGVLTLNQAVDMATKDFLDKGINSIIYKDGKRVNIASYAEMCLRTASQRATFLGEGKKRDEFGIHLVVVTAHANTCKMCAPWQGQILIDDVFSHPSKEYIEEYSKKYKLLSEAIKNNFFHPNCRHSVTTFFEGITKIPTVPDEKKAIKTYEAEQKQRAHERVIRKQKRIREGACNETNRDEADKKVRLHQKLIRDILKEHPELRRNAGREKIDFRSIKQLNYKKDLKQLKKFKEILGEDAPKTLEDFQNLKYNNIKEYKSMKDFISSKESKKIPLDTTLKQWNAIATETNNKIVGIVTPNGIKIQEVSKHMIERFIGDGVKRKSVPVDSVANALSKPLEIKEIKIDDLGRKSQKFVGEYSTVTINPDTGNLVQTNPTSKKLAERLKRRKENDNIK